MTTLITLEGVSKCYVRPDGSRYWVYRDVNLELPARKNIGIVGRNGAGKSTLIRLLSGVDTPDRGRVISHASLSPPVGLSSGFSAALTGRENAKFVCRIRGDGREVMKDRLEFVKEFSELGDFFEQPLSTYSSGMRSRLSFAVSMAFDYDCYLLDEVTSAGDQKFRERADAAFKDLVARASIILVSHSMGTLRQWCEAGLYIRNGEIRYYDQISRAIDDYLQDQK